MICICCGKDASVCPVCEGVGETMVPVESKRMQRVVEDDFVEVPCEHCDGTGKHVCLPARCFCDKDAVFFDRESGERLCAVHAALDFQPVLFGQIVRCAC